VILPIIEECLTITLQDATKRMNSGSEKSKQTIMIAT
jgi:hypothetical protein